jgi:SAM-dependent methyltransferase
MFTLKSDQEKWNRRYEREHHIDAPDEFLVSRASMLGTGFALDLACGLGGNSLFLAERGYSVHAVDISYEALSKLHREAVLRNLSIQPIVADLDYFSLPPEHYDLIIVFYFFSRDLMPRIVSALKNDGLLFYATYNIRHISVRPEFNKDYLIQPDELVQYFSGFDILVYEPDAGENRNISRVLARKESR